MFEEICIMLYKGCWKQCIVPLINDSRFILLHRLLFMLIFLNAVLNKYLHFSILSKPLRYPGSDHTRPNEWFFHFYNWSVEVKVS